jgi:hypothetical protein
MRRSEQKATLTAAEGISIQWGQGRTTVETRYQTAVDLPDETFNWRCEGIMPIRGTHAALTIDRQAVICV